MAEDTLSELRSKMKAATDWEAVAKLYSVMSDVDVKAIENFNENEWDDGHRLWCLMHHSPEFVAESAFAGPLRFVLLSWYRILMPVPGGGYLFAKMPARYESPSAPKEVLYVPQQEVDASTSLMKHLQQVVKQHPRGGERH